QPGGDTYKPSQKGKSDEQPAAKSDDGDKEDKKDEKKEPKKPIVIELDGLEARLVPLPVPPGRFGRIAVNDKGHLVYLRQPVGQGGPGVEGEIKIFDLSDEKKEEKTITKANDFEITADGKKILAKKGKESQVFDAAADAKGKTIVTSGMVATIDPRQE